MTVTTRQRFTYREIPRAAILEAPYNPRTMSAYAKGKLRKSLAADGLVETLVWNARTGHLVGGHQRLQLLDDLHAGADYLLGVAAVDLSEADERTQNVFLNNVYAQGSYVEEKFVEVVQGGASLDAMGFTVPDLEAEFGLVPALDPSFAAMREAQAPLVDAIKAVEAHRNFREMDAAIAQQNEDVGYGDSDYTLAIVFATPADRDAFCAHYSVPADRLMLADDLITRLEPPYRWRVETTPDANADAAV
jgi:hypothetical protein